MVRESRPAGQVANPLPERWLEQGERWLGAFGIQVIPTLMAMRDGIIVYQHAGALPAHALQNLIDEIESLDMMEVRADVGKQAWSAALS